MKKYVFSQIFAIPPQKPHTTISKSMIIQSKCHQIKTRQNILWNLCISFPYKTHIYLILDEKFFSLE